MSTITFTTAPRTVSRVSVTTPTEAVTASSAEGRMIAHVIGAELAVESENRRIRRAAERHRERIVTGITVAACSVAGVAAITFAQLLVVAR